MTGKKGKTKPRLKAGNPYTHRPCGRRRTGPYCVSRWGKSCSWRDAKGCRLSKGGREVARRLKKQIIEVK